MNKSQALYKFWSGFGIPAYEENSVPDEAMLPYITYSESTSTIGNTTPLSASIWYFSEGWAEIINKTADISEGIGYGGVTVKYDNGLLWVNRGRPFAQRMNEPSDRRIKRMLLNIYAEFISQN